MFSKETEEKILYKKIENFLSGKTQMFFIWKNSNVLYLKKFKTCYLKTVSRCHGDIGDGGFREPVPKQDGWQNFLKKFADYKGFMVWDYLLCQGMP